jgi:hypothetical protein
MMVAEAYASAQNQTIIAKTIVAYQTNVVETQAICGSLTTGSLKLIIAVQTPHAGEPHSPTDQAVLMAKKSM